MHISLPYHTTPYKRVYMCGRVCYRVGVVTSTGMAVTFILLTKQYPDACEYIHTYTYTYKQTFFLYLA